MVISNIQVRAVGLLGLGKFSRLKGLGFQVCKKCLVDAGLAMLSGHFLRFIIDMQGF